MKKKLLFLAALVLASLQLTAANVDLATAQQSAQRFLMSQAVKGRFMATPPSVKWTQEVKNSSNPALTAFYIVNTDNGYVIVSGDNRAKEVLAYGEGTLTSLNDLPEAVQYFFDIYQKQMEYLQAHPELVVQKRAATRGVSVDPMLQTAWAQDKPYNKQCPKVGNTYCKVGCTAVALAQVIRYWEYPQVAPALPAYVCEESHINVPALPGNYTFDWANMYDTYYEVDLDRLPQVNEDAIAYLMRYVGQAEKVDYNTNQTGTRNPEILTAIQTFGFDEGAHIVKKCDSPDTPEELAAGEFTEEPYFTDEGWAEAIQAELRAGRPLIYCAYDMSSDSTGLGGHAFNVDGYDAVNDMYHVNFGMKPSLNTYYALDAFSTDGWLVVYDFWPIFFGGVQPPGMVTEPRILVSPQELSMDCYTGETATATFNVVGERLSDDITVALDDANGVFTVDASTIAVVDSAANVTVTVTYAPQAVGTHNATITLSSDGVESKVVTLKGTATNAPLVVYKPVMQPADSAYINLTSFRANWTDSTAVDNVLSYTLEVNEKPVYNYLADADWSNTDEVFSNQASSWETSGLIPEGWSFAGSNLWAENHFISIQSASISTPEFSGCDKVTVIFTAESLYASTSITVATSQDSESIALPGSFTQFVVVLNCAPTDKVTFTAGSSYVGLLKATVYAGEVSAPEMREVVETGDTAHRLITGITDKFYTVTNLTAEGTYNYKVKALYADGTESDWSNVEQVTLFANTPAHDYGLGDYNHDRLIDIEDATMMINDLLYNTNDGCPICGDLNHDNKIDIEDATALINVLLFGWE